MKHLLIFFLYLFFVIGVQSTRNDLQETSYIAGSREFYTTSGRASSYSSSDHPGFDSSSYSPGTDTSSESSSPDSSSYRSWTETSSDSSSPDSSSYRSWTETSSDSSFSDTSEGASYTYTSSGSSWMHYSTSESPYWDTTASPLSCEHPYDLVGDRCVFVDPILKGTWEEARYVCGRSGGDLAVLDSMDFYSSIIQYLKYNGLTLHDYWVGGRGDSSQGIWQWVSGSEVRMATPLWALMSSYGDNNGTGYQQEPVSFYKSLENCGYLDVERFHYMDDDDCLDLKAAICQLPNAQEETEEEEKPNVYCEHPFDPIGDRCVLVDPFADATWDEARYVCERYDNSHLVSLDSMTFFGDLVDYLEANGLDTHDYWVGGKTNSGENMWTWVDGGEVIDGTPLWALTQYYGQEPDHYTTGLCGYLDQDRFYFMDNDECPTKKALMCQQRVYRETDNNDESQDDSNNKDSKPLTKVLNQLVKKKKARKHLDNEEVLKEIFLGKDFN